MDGWPEREKGGQMRIGPKTNLKIGCVVFIVIAIIFIILLYQAIAFEIEIHGIKRI